MVVVVQAKMHRKAHFFLGRGSENWTTEGHQSARCSSLFRLMQARLKTGSVLTVVFVTAVHLL